MLFAFAHAAAALQLPKRKGCPDYIQKDVEQIESVMDDLLPNDNGTNPPARSRTSNLGRNKSCIHSTKPSRINYQML